MSSRSGKGRTLKQLAKFASLCRGPARVVNFETYDVGRVELWEMGSHGPNNGYGEIDLTPGGDAVAAW
ncbi:hypothetical protein M378DRAFT_173141 [Amanita muscaria Koide BX008]|uniref:Uncharacterized protein n=1 Tax=Amanita muscaria (strain Koide BX008) TaxID=946122 RepID=A0A0C2WH16_AMAMK|nr:hypothetical protein M378DRAFT_173141 [Amanita muscaria Koide BX008]